MKQGWQMLLPNRRSIRLAGYDYSRPGYYYFTICLHAQALVLLGSIGNGPEGKYYKASMVTNEMGDLVAETWLDLPNHIANIELDEFVVMPDHVHGIVRIVEPNVYVVPVGAGLEPAPTGMIPVPTNIPVAISESILMNPPRKKRHGFPEIVRQFKTFSARRINVKRNFPGWPVWQRNYYETIVRDEVALDRMRQYIRDNPRKWAAGHIGPPWRQVCNHNQ